MKNHKSPSHPTILVMNSRYWQRWSRTLLISLALVGASLAVVSSGRATCLQGCDLGNANTFLGDDVLLNNISGANNNAFGVLSLTNNTTGSYNTGNGGETLMSNTTGATNTALGFAALENNTTGSYNTGIGGYALAGNTTGIYNTGSGVDVLFANTTGYYNTGSGAFALFSNTTGNNNVSIGFNALATNTTGVQNTATGAYALYSNNVANNNTAEGFSALKSNTSGTSNTAVGYNALTKNTTGSNNVAIGASAGGGLTTGSNNIDIGAFGAAAESNTIRIGSVTTPPTAVYIQGISGATVSGGVGVVVNSSGRLGTLTSSVRYKDDIKPMAQSSEAILSLQPVTFRYKKELDPAGIPQFGLVAEQVEKVDPDLVARDDNGKPYSVRYEAVNAMLLNEFLKEHRKVQNLEATVAQQQSTNAEQQQAIKALSAALKEQATQIQKVTAQLSALQVTPRLVTNE